MPAKKKTALIYLAEIDNLKGQLEAALRDKAKAIEEERAACEKIAQTYYDLREAQEGCDCCELALCIAEEIRARSKS